MGAAVSLKTAILPSKMHISSQGYKGYGIQRFARGSRSPLSREIRIGAPALLSLLISVSLVSFDKI